VILPENWSLIGVNDSKMLSEKKRNNLYEEITKNAISIGIGCISEEIIDKINILQATYQAMNEAVAQLNIIPDCLVIDALHLQGCAINQESIIKGDSKSFSIAAASIIAKVTRDRMMLTYDSEYPRYGFARHKGYGTKNHYEALKAYGPCPIHRKTFLGSLNSIESH
jgi:ribonuclease HII